MKEKGEGPEGPKAGGSPAERSRGAIFRYFASNAARSGIPQGTLASLDRIRGSGLRQLERLRPYKDASVFYLRFSERFGDSSKGRPDLAAFSGGAASSIRKELDSARNLASGMLAKFPREDADLEVTSAVSALFLAGAVARFCPDLILESAAGEEEKRALAERFIAFFDSRLARFLSEGKWDDARKLHAECYESYLAFKKEMPELFDPLRSKLWASGGELMAPYGSGEFSMSWTSYYYRGRL